MSLKALFCVFNRASKISNINVQDRESSDGLACPQSICLSLMLFSSVSALAEQSPILKWPSYPVRFAATLAVVLFFIIQYIRKKK